MDDFARIIIFAGIAVAIAGVLLLGAARLGLGRLPGDLAFEGESVRVYVPIATSIVLSIVLTVVLNVALRIWR
jgi:hypothetical protein